jgi:signal transduction histidine kinase
VSARWYRSLYWRITVGFVLCLAAVLLVQALLFVLVVSRSGPTMPGVPPERFARTAAQELSQALERDAALDVQAFIRDQYGRDAHPLFVVLEDGRTFSNSSEPAPEPLIAAARDRLRRGGAPRRRPTEARGPRGMRQPLEPMEDGPPGDAGASDGTPPGGFARRGGPGFMGGRFAPIVAGGRLAGFVIVPPRAPFGFLLARYGPTLGLVALGSFMVGGTLTAFLVFGPANRRLRGLEDAARRLGAGDLTARAPAQGGDEVSAVATAFNAMADDLAARAEALTAADRTRRQLLADVSHELATPVTAMRGYLETLAMPDFPLDELTRARYLGIVTDETARLERIIGDLLELARLEGGGGALAIEAVPVSALFDRVVARHDRTASASGVTIATSIAPGAETVRGDRDRLEQALQNLAANALRHAPPGTAVELAARPRAPGVALSVTDHGAGLDAVHLPRVFDRFYKADAARVNRSGAGTTGHGSGLGLSIVKAIVGRHGGTVTVESAPGRTTFDIHLP